VKLEGQESPLNTTEPRRVAIVGGGCCGTLVAAHLLRQHHPAHIDIIDERIPGRGLAYSTAWDDHLLNVPAVRMSVFGSEPMHFLEWLRTHGRPDATADCFAPRKVFGSYLQDVLHESVRAAAGTSRFRHHYSKATRLSYDGRIARISLEDGERIQADKVVLATGNPAPCSLEPAVPGCFHSPWEPGALTGLDPDADVLLLGAGLTAVDAFLALQAQGHRGTIHCVSRRGKLPRVHTLYRTLHKPFDSSGATSARGLLCAIRLRAREAEREGYDWRAVVDSLRPVTNDIWCSLDRCEQRRILRHLKTWWDIHRHRMAPEIGSRVGLALEGGRLVVHAGRLAEFDGQRARIHLRTQAPLSLRVQRLINCTGSDENYRRSANPLLRSLLESGRIRSNAIGRGLETDRHGALIESDGTASGWLFTLGPPRVGGLFETTAVPEIRKQAEALASYLFSIDYEPEELPVDYFLAAGI
jgi:uncharacterized NAD(P)/FAD-binding protein YdhS